jgi:hypothetical protein
VVSKPTLHKYPVRQPSKRKAATKTNPTAKKTKKTPVIDSLPQSVESNGTEDFENIFRELVSSYNKLSPEDRTEKIRRVLENVDQNSMNVQNLIKQLASESQSEIVDLFSSTSDLENFYPEIFGKLLSWP